MTIRRKDSIDGHLNEAEWRTNQFINQSDFAEVIEGNHMMFARSGFHCPGLLYPNGFQTSSTSFTKTNDAAGPHLTIWEGIGVCRRIDPKVGSPQADIRLSAVLQDASIRLNVRRLNSDGTTTGLPNIFYGPTNTGAPEGVTSYQDYTEAEVSDMGNASNEKAPILFDVEVRAEDSDPTNNPAHLYHWWVDEDDLTNRNLST